METPAIVQLKRTHKADEEQKEMMMVSKKNKAMKEWVDPVQSLASSRHEFGEHGGVNMSIEASVTFTVMEPETMKRMFSGELGPERDFYIYSRHFNPTVLNLARQMAALEGTEAAYCTASGMAAISSALLQICSHGHRIVASSCLYGGTYALLSHFLPAKCNIVTDFVNIHDLGEVKAALKESSSVTKVLYFESVSNPTLQVADIPGLCALAREMIPDITVVVDNTFAPMVLSPAKHGADVVVHSLSKFISGGADVIGGAVCGPRKLINGMMDLRTGPLMVLGPTMNPQVAFDISERIPHLALRVKEHSHRALTYASNIKSMLKTSTTGFIKDVIYPGFEDHPQHSLLKAIVNPGYGFGGIFCVDMETEEKANRLMMHLQNTTQFGLMAVSLGYYETLMSCSGNSTSSELNPQEKALAGISPGLIRMSVGYTGTVEQRWSQFQNALHKIMEDIKLGF